MLATLTVSFLSGIATSKQCHPIQHSNAHMSSPSPTSAESRSSPTVATNGVSSLQRWLYLVSLMLAGESIYMLPYLRKSFQTSMEEAFRIDAVELGILNGMFGILALACYLPGGWLADRFSARGLLAFSLVATGLGGLVMLGTPSYTQLLALHAFWGITSVLTFWAALIKATRGWGGSENQGLSFGLLDGGRGVVAAILVSIATTAFAFSATPVEGLTRVILVYVTATLVAGVAVWMFVPQRFADGGARPDGGVQRSLPVMLARTRVCVTRNRAWLLALIIFCAYFLFLGTYEFPAFAERGYGQSKLFGAQLATFRDWLRPVAAITAGLLADRLRPSDTLAGSFFLLAVSYCALALITPEAGSLWMLWLPVGTAAIAVFALRGVYFAVLQESRIPMSMTGTIVGVVSVVGYLPDIFAPVLAGWFVVNFPDGDGYRYYFGLLACVAVIGLAASFAVARRGRDNAETTAV